MVGIEVEARGQAGGENLRRLKALLAELFMFDQADLDFGIYRIMNLRREEITRFLNDDLLTQVREALGDVAAGERAVIERELDEAEAGARQLGMNPDDAPKVRELRAELDAKPDIGTAEEEVYSHLVTFFRRYYKEGDFISQRRYKEGVYAIPYEGEEVKLHWANADQYYVKSAEHFRDYTFLLPDGRRVHFKLVEASTETNNNRAQNGNDQRFILADEESVAEQDGELVVRFEYRPDPDGRKRDEVNAESVERILDDPAAAAWQVALARDTRPADAKEALSVLRRHLNTYTAKNEFDYFIHKDLGDFLRRELDFYLKNEVMHLDDIDQDGKSAPDVERYLDKLQATRRVGHKIIEFLAQLEDFQKRLWLKKKFVVETHWCVTLDRIPEELYEEIAANDRQRQEWVRLFAIDQITGDMVAPGYSEPLTEAFLQANQHLVVDTSLFDREFVGHLLAGIEDLDESTDGVLVHSENFQALQLMRTRYRGQVHSIYIDPPYNTDGSPINYKNNYRRSSWASLITDRVHIGRLFLRDTGMHCATIDDYQQRELHYLLEDEFGEDNYGATVTIRMNPSGRPVPAGFAQSHEYAVFHQNSSAAHAGKLPRSESQRSRYRHTDDAGRFMWELFRKRGSASERSDRPSLYYPVYVSGEAVRVPAMTYDEERRLWDIHEEPRPDEIVAYPVDENGVERRWRGAPESIRRYPSNYRAQQDDAGSITLYYKFRPAADVLPLTVWADAKYSATEHGTGLLKQMFTEYNVFSYPKSVYAVEDCLRVAGAGDGESLTLDYFAGSGTTGHAVINLNREDGGQRKYILVEMGEYFDTVLKPRVLKAVYSKDWRDGKPVSREGVSQLIKVIRLESYEDVLNNLEVRRTEQQQSLLNAHDGLREEYMLRYWLDVETHGSASLLDIERLDDPWSYTLNDCSGQRGRDEAGDGRPSRDVQLPDRPESEARRCAPRRHDGAGHAAVGREGARHLAQGRRHAERGAGPVPVQPEHQPAGHGVRRHLRERRQPPREHAPSRRDLEGAPRRGGVPAA